MRGVLTSSKTCFDSAAADGVATAAPSHCATTTAEQTQHQQCKITAGSEAPASNWPFLSLDDEPRLCFYFVRHAEGLHNRAAKNRSAGVSRDEIFCSPEFFDATLSAQGRQQCLSAARHMPLSLKRALWLQYYRQEQLKQHLLQQRHLEKQQQQEQQLGSAICTDQLGDQHLQQKAAIISDNNNENSVWILSSTLRRTVQTAHLIVAAALQDEQQKLHECSPEQKSCSNHCSSSAAISGHSSFSSGSFCDGRDLASNPCCNGLNGENGNTKIFDENDRLRRSRRGGGRCNDSSTSPSSRQETRRSSAGASKKTSHPEDEELLHLPPVPAALPATALECMREWSGGGHACDGRVSLSELKKFCVPRFEKITFEAPEVDSLPFNSPREDSYNVEKRCLAFCRYVYNLAVAAATAGRSCRQLTSDFEKKDEEVASKEFMSSQKSQKVLHFLCVAHSAWTRHFLTLLGLFDPSSRGLNTAQWCCFSAPLSSLRQAVTTLDSQLPYKEHMRQPLSSRSCFPLQFPTASFFAGEAAETGGSVKSRIQAKEQGKEEEKTLSSIRRSIHLPTLDCLLQSVVISPFSLLLFPPPSPNIVAAAQKWVQQQQRQLQESLTLEEKKEQQQRLTEQLQQTPLADASGFSTGGNPILERAQFRVLVWLYERQRVVDSSAVLAAGKVGGVAAPFDKETAARLKIQLRQSWVLHGATENTRRCEVATDASLCLKPVLPSEQAPATLSKGKLHAQQVPEGNWEVVAKERVHRQTCILLIMPGHELSKVGSHGTAERSCNTSSSDTMEKDIKFICDKLLVVSGGASVVYPVYVESLSE